MPDRDELLPLDGRGDGETREKAAPPLCDCPYHRWARQEDAKATPADGDRETILPFEATP